MPSRELPSSTLQSFEEYLSEIVQTKSLIGLPMPSVQSLEEYWANNARISQELSDLALYIPRGQQTPRDPQIAHRRLRQEKEKRVASELYGGKPYGVEESTD